ncbi:glutaredoxin family protein [Glaciimonas sp. PCH181]|uniref:glutaredoxin family protein n=1 Tax=Glaciimonas sp. PCH181 TaxID=2133943 RepID=UPI000D3C4888|nr:glutaredoxin family protein [Glaciimonas sp. PCH181]PUA17075.1 glutaredoxin family protein [Glaciimonas sp. PCH181]
MKLAASVFSITSLAFCLLIAPSAQAELYKSIGPNGQITYSDSPPPSGKIVEKISLITKSDADASGFPYELAQTTKNNPVTLYTSAKCLPCDDGRNLLISRGIPFSEKTISTNEDLARLKAISGENQLPLLRIGRSNENGYEASVWNKALSTAGYPASNQLPPSYRNGQAAAAAPVAATTKGSPATGSPSKNKANTVSGQQLPATGNAPPGFQF